MGGRAGARTVLWRRWSVEGEMRHQMGRLDGHMLGCPLAEGCQGEASEGRRASHWRSWGLRRHQVIKLGRSLAEGCQGVASEGRRASYWRRDGRARRAGARPLIGGRSLGSGVVGTTGPARSFIGGGLEVERVRHRKPWAGSGRCVTSRDSVKEEGNNVGPGIKGWAREGEKHVLQSRCLTR